MLRSNLIPNFAFILIFCVGVFLRVYNLDSVPPHPSLDEVSIGYNAYSILQTGKDEYGTSYPWLLRSYDDYRPALYVYLVIPFIKLFGLSALAVRLPSVLLSIGVLASAYFLVKHLVENRSLKVFGITVNIPLLSMLFLAISPWHIYISRLGHEVNSFFSFFIFGMLFFFTFLQTQKKSYFLILSAVFFALSFSAYQSGKIFIPLILLVLGVLYYKKLLLRKKVLIISVIVGLLIILPTLIVSRNPDALIRFKATNIFSTTQHFVDRSAVRVSRDKENGNLLGQALNNRRLVYVLVPTVSYLSHFNPVWLFTNLGGEPFKIPDLGLMHIIELPLTLIGLFYFYGRCRVGNRIKVLATLWVLFSIIPGAITTGYPHAMRIFQLLPIPSLFSGIGLFMLLEYLSVFRRTARNILSILIILVVLFSSLFFYNSYFTNFPHELANQFQYGAIQAFKASKKMDGNFEKVFISNRDNLFQSYMFYLYETGLSPEEYQKNGGTKSGGFAESHVIGKYNFGSVERVDDNSLVIAGPYEFNGGTIIDKIKLPNGNDAIWLIDTGNQ